MGALIYAPVAGQVHVYLNEHVDLPALALPWLVLLGLGVAGGIRALREVGPTWLERVVGAASLLLALGQAAGGVAIVISGLLNSLWFFSKRERSHPARAFYTVRRFGVVSRPVGARQGGA